MTVTEDIPPGFRPLNLHGGFSNILSPVYGHVADGKAVLAFRVRDPHTNPFGICHGGAISTFADLQIIGAQQIVGMTDRFMPTINLSLDYIAPAKLGAWLELHVERVRATSTLIFTSSVMLTGETLIARASGIYKIPRSPHPDLAGKPSRFGG